MYERSIKHGSADYASWMQIADTAVYALTALEGAETMPLADQRFAKLVYTINQPVLSLSGATVATYAQPFATQILVSGNYTWVSKAPPGTYTSDNKWAIQQILVSGGLTTITWPNGDSSSTYVADNAPYYNNYR